MKVILSDLSFIGHMLKKYKLHLMLKMRGSLLIYVIISSSWQKYENDFDFENKLHIFYPVAFN